MHSHIVVVFVSLILTFEVSPVCGSVNGDNGVQSAQKTLEIKTFGYQRVRRAVANTIGGENEHETGNTSTESNNIPNSDLHSNEVTGGGLETGTNSDVTVNNATSAIANPATESVSKSATRAINESSGITSASQSTSVQTNVIDDNTSHTTGIDESVRNILPTTTETPAFTLFQESVKVNSSFAKNSVIVTSEVPPTATKSVSSSAYSAIQTSFSSYKSQAPEPSFTASLSNIHSVPSTTPPSGTHSTSASVGHSSTSATELIPSSTQSPMSADTDTNITKISQTESAGSLLPDPSVSTDAANATDHSGDVTSDKTAPEAAADGTTHLSDTTTDSTIEGSGHVSSFSVAGHSEPEFITDDSLKSSSTSLTQSPTTTSVPSSSSLSSQSPPPPIHSPETAVTSTIMTSQVATTTRTSTTTTTPTTTTPKATTATSTTTPPTTVATAPETTNSITPTTQRTSALPTVTTSPPVDESETPAPERSDSDSSGPLRSEAFTQQPNVTSSLPPVVTSLVTAHNPPFTVDLPTSPTNTTSTIEHPAITSDIATTESTQTLINIPDTFRTTLEPNTGPGNETTGTTNGEIVTTRQTKETVSTTTSEPEAEPTAEPVPEDNDDHGGPSEPEDTSSVKPKSDPESEPEDDAKVKPEFNLEAFAEPGPDWEIAKVVWKEAWEFHVYLFGLCFAMLGLYCVLSVIRLWYMEHLLSRNYFVTLHLHVICVCVLRATYLLVDAYNSFGLFPMVMDYFLYSTVFPCMTSSFSIIFYALLLATRVRVMSAKVQKLWVLIVIIVLHFTLSISTDIVVGLFSTAPVLIFVCQVVFILWGLLMFIGYLIIFRKLYKGAVKRQKAIKSNSTDRLNSSNPALYGDKYEKHKYTFDLAVKITFASAFFGVAIVGFELYGIFGVYGVLRAVSKPEPWPWWTYHFILRSLELLMCFSIAYIASQPLKYTVRKDRNRLYPYLLPCNMCCCNDTRNQSYDSSTMDMDVGSDNDHLGWHIKFKAKRHSAAHALYPPHTSEKYSDPDATLLVRKIKQPRPSMLVVEDGFVRIRRDDEIMPSNQYEMDSNSRSSLSSGLNFSQGGGAANLDVVNSVVNWNFNSGVNRAGFRNDNIHSFSFNDYIIPRAEDQLESSSEIHQPASADETDVDIVVTESVGSDVETSGRAAYPESPKSGKSGDIFRSLSMIDLAASMESELDRAFHSSGVDHIELESHSSLPPFLDDYNSDAFNEPMYDRFCCDDNVFHDDVTGAMTFDSNSEQSKAQSTRLLHSPVRRCISDGKPPTPKTKRFENNRYFSLSSVESVGQEDESFECILDFRSNRK